MTVVMASHDSVPFFVRLCHFLQSRSGVSLVRHLRSSILTLDFGSLLASSFLFESIQFSSASELPSAPGVGGDDSKKPQH